MNTSNEPSSPEAATPETDKVVIDRGDVTKAAFGAGWNAGYATPAKKTKAL